MKQYHLMNNIIGWLIGIVACTVYILTAEATASWWDCGEYIATAFKLQVGHPPGAPTFQLLGRIFSMFSAPTSAAHAINVMSAVCSGLTIMFLYWGITLLGKHLLPDPKNPSVNDMCTWGVFAAGVVGSLAYTFTDTFWFSAVEGEVYAMSSFFTSVVFWVILKWEEQADEDWALGWLVLICLLVSVAIGVHLLNLLAVPAVVYVVYFKKWKETTVKGFLLSGVISVALLAIILWGIIPGIVNLDSAFDVFFVNTLGLPFNSGTIFYFVLLAALCIVGLWLTSAKKYNKPLANAAILGFVMLVLGYSTFFILVIRANTNTPLNENAPKDAVAMRAYLGREQYGQTPVFHGQYYTAGDPIETKDGYAKYVRGKDENGKDKYIVADHAKKYIYRKEHTGALPRMYSNDNGRGHPRFYEYWAGKVPNGKHPSGAQNIKYMNAYQFNWMYWRYFMWNFAGRQNDIQGHHFNNDGTIDYLNGNWISGIKAIDEARLGPQDNLPNHYANNKGRNVYYMLPLLLGIIGMVFHFLKHRKDAFIVLIMFVMTGLAIAFYLNMPPRQPRERDYAFVGSFCFFAIWIGLGVMAIAEWLNNLFDKDMYKVLLPISFVVCMGVPAILAAENWDDHDRSQKYAARDFAKNYLNSMNENGILITFGDNDTFPLWYAQEVEDVRTDVRILNYTLSGMYWYVEQLYNKLYESEAMPFTLPKEYYGLGKDIVVLQDNVNDFIEVTELLTLLKEHPEKFTLYNRGEELLCLPTKKFKITLDIPALVAKGVIPEEIADKINPEIRWEVKKNILYRHELMMLDILGTNKFMRDINIMNVSYIADVFPVAYQCSVQDGMSYKLLPYPSQSRYTAKTADYYLNGINGKPLQWGNLNADIYVDPISLNMGVVQRQSFHQLAAESLEKGDTVTARKFCNMAMEFFPAKNFPLDIYAIYVSTGNYHLDIVDLYKKVYGIEKARELWDAVFEYYKQEHDYLSQFKGKKAKGVQQELQGDIQILGILGGQAQQFLGDQERAQRIEEIINRYNYTI